MRKPLAILAACLALLVVLAVNFPVFDFVRDIASEFGLGGEVPERIRGPELPENAEYYEVSYEWRYGGYAWTYSARIPRDIYEHFASRGRVSDFSEYVTNPDDDQWVEDLAGDFRSAAEERGWDQFRTVSLVLAFVQSLPYTEDKVTTGYDEYPRYPIETLVEGGGDCENTTILFISIVREMGYGTVLLILEEDAHVAGGVKISWGVVSDWARPYPLTYYEHEGGLYAYCETTGEGWELGQMPEGFESEEARIVEVG